MEKWNAWNPVENIPASLYLEELKDSHLGLSLHLKESSSSQLALHVFFDSAISYRNHNEGDVINMLSQQGAETNNPLCIVENSDYLKWFHNESCGIYKSKKLVHYLFLTPDDIVDVLSAYSPTVEWVN